MDAWLEFFVEDVLVSQQLLGVLQRVRLRREPDMPRIVDDRLDFLVLMVVLEHLVLQHLLLLKHLQIVLGDLLLRAIVNGLDVILPQTVQQFTVLRF